MLKFVKTPKSKTCLVSLVVDQGDPDCTKLKTVVGTEGRSNKKHRAVQNLSKRLKYRASHG